MRFILEVFFHDEDPSRRWVLPDFRLDIATSEEAYDWIDYSVRKAVLYDIATNRVQILKDE
jgi:hypothetical protein